MASDRESLKERCGVHINAFGIPEWRKSSDKIHNYLIKKCDIPFSLAEHFPAAVTCKPDPGTANASVDWLHLALPLHWFRGTQREYS